ncbi:alpha/beta fold hydrolase [Baekduia sp. Peel2402]|uniref:alpha/beta fold hydrolase n=1 Tax=Baekduia sp. Peel2402 TaxID=3458296 RepID=UPI00403E3BA8
MPPRDAIDVPLADGRHLRVRRTPGRGRPVVLLHGLLDDATGWAGVMARATSPCVAVDLPGFGGSSAPRDATLAAYAQDVAEALGRMEIAHATVVGHSLGGGVAAALAQRSSAVDALALLAPVGFGPIRLAELASLPGVRHGLQAALPLGLVNPLVVTAAYSTLVAHRRLPSADLVARLSRGALRSGRGARMAVEAVAAAGRDAQDPAPPFAFEGPVAAVWGARDALVPPAHAATLQRVYPQARVEVWDGMGHHPQRERAAELDRFLTKAAWSARTRAAARWGAPGPAIAPIARRAA